MALLITDAELLAMGIASDALASIALSVRDIARASASGLALSQVKKRHLLPLIQWGDDLKRAVVHIAAYDLLTTRGFNPQAGADVAIRDRYLAALSWLKSVAKGEAELTDVIDSSPTVHERGPLVSTSSGGPLWPNYGTPLKKKATFL